MIQYFKGDKEELKFVNSTNEVFQNISQNLDSMFDDAYSCFKFGDILWDSKRTPLSKSVVKKIFRESFFTIFSNFLVAGSFESYITVFENIFGEDVEVIFTVPAPGKLLIDVTASGLQLDTFLLREIVDNEYVYSNLIDDEGDTIVFQSVKGLESQYELEQMLNEMVPYGIYTEISLTLGGE